MNAKRIIILAVTCLTGAAALALLYWANQRADHGLSIFSVVGAPLLLISAGVAGYVLGRRNGESIVKMSRQLQQQSADGRIVPLEGVVGRDLAPLAAAVNGLLASVQEKLQAQTLMVREQQIRTRVLQADKQHMEAVLNSIADTVLVTNAFGDVTLANRAAEESLGFRFDAGQRRPVSEVIADPALLTVFDQLRRSELHVPRKVIEMTRGSNGDTRIYKTTVNAVRTTGGEREELTGLVTVLHDVTREREAAKLKNEFVSKVTHELRTPLSSIRAYVEMLVDGEARDEQTRSEFYKIIDSESDRLARMIENMLNISRIEAGVVKVQKKDLALTGLIKEAVDCLQPQASAKHLLLEADLSAVFYQVHADRDMLYQAVLNVISNAIKYTPDGGRIKVATALENGMVAIRISDSGLGIPAEDLPRLFEKFYRVGANKKAAKGTGLGLALVKEIIETLHHGQIDVESTVGKGTTFSLKLPVAG